MNERVLASRTVRDLSVADLRNMPHSASAERTGCEAVAERSHSSWGVAPAGDLIVRN